MGHAATDRYDDNGGTFCTGSPRCRTTRALVVISSGQILKESDSNSMVILMDCSTFGAKLVCRPYCDRALSWNWTGAGFGWTRIWGRKHRFSVFMIIRKVDG